MNPLRTALLVSLVVGVSGVAVAEPFKEHSNWMASTPIASAPSLAQGDLATTNRFKEKNAWAAIAVSQPGVVESFDVCLTDTVLAAHTPHFNNKYNFQC